MATSTLSTVATNSSNANFSAWCRAVSSALTACSFVKTSDTGQVDWTSDQTAPAGANTYPYYEMRRFNDSLSGTSELYVKIEYGEGGGTDTPALRFTFSAVASNGSGGFASASHGPYVVSANTASSSTLTSYVSGASGRINANMFPTNSASHFGFVISRTCSSSGAFNSNGFQILLSSIGTSATNSVAKRQLFIDKNNNIRGPYLQFTAMNPVAGTGAYGANVGMFPIFPNIGGFDYPTPDGILVFLTDVGSAGTPVGPITIYGSSMNFYSGANALANNGSANTLVLLYRFD